MLQNWWQKAYIFGQALRNCGAVCKNSKWRRRKRQKYHWILMALFKRFERWFISPEMVWSCRYDKLVFRVFSLVVKDEEKWHTGEPVCALAGRPSSHSQSPTAGRGDKRVKNRLFLFNPYWVWQRFCDNVTLDLKGRLVPSSCVFFFWSSLYFPPWFQSPSWQESLCNCTP